MSKRRAAIVDQLALRPHHQVLEIRRVGLFQREPARARGLVEPWLARGRPDTNVLRSRPDAESEIAGLELLGQHVHQQAVAPVSVAPQLGPSLHSDALEPDALVAADRALVLRRRIDHEAVVAAVVHQVSREDEHGIAAQAAALVVAPEKEVDSRMAICRIELLPDFGVADELAPMLDREGVADMRVEVLTVDMGPPAGDLWLARKREQRREITHLEQPEHDTFATELHVSTICHARLQPTPCAQTESRAGARAGALVGVTRIDRRVASTEPASTKTKPTPMPTVNCSPRIATPNTAATAGFT